MPYFHVIFFHLTFAALFSPLIFTPNFRTLVSCFSLTPYFRASFLWPYFCALLSRLNINYEHSIVFLIFPPNFFFCISNNIHLIGVSFDRPFSSHYQFLKDVDSRRSTILGKQRCVLVSPESPGPATQWSTSLLCGPAKLDSPCFATSSIDEISIYF